MKLLILRLEGVLQSWGERSHWDHRDTAAFPTKSGIVGLLGCALGLPRGDERLAELGNKLSLAVRADRPGSVMTDFHTVQSRVGEFLNAEGRELSSVLERFSEGDGFFFDLLTYPNKKKDVGRGNSARVFLQTQEERSAWLARQGEKCGFELVACREDEPCDIRGRRETGLITFRTVRFTGILRITDAAAFHRAYAEGVGPEKAYGLGMCCCGGGVNSLPEGSLSASVLSVHQQTGSGISSRS